MNAKLLPDRAKNAGEGQSMEENGYGMTEQKHQRTGIYIRRKDKTESVVYAGIDGFRLLASVMVIAIHTAPLAGLSGNLDFILTYCLGRVAVPFFLMTTGYFMLGAWKLSGCTEDEKVIRSMKKALFLYAAAFVFYLPVNFYTGVVPKSAGRFLQMIIFDGGFYHLWYFPAVILGCIIIVALMKRFSVQAVFAIAVLLYVIGAGGDIYYGVVNRIPVLEHLYKMIFTVSSYTRNGVFYAPVFLTLGMMMRDNTGEDGKRKTHKGMTGLVIGLSVSLLLMFAEGYFTYSHNLQRHNSMYLCLIPVMYFLFRLLLLVTGKAPGWARNVSMLVYIIHPAVRIGLRGAAGAAGVTGLLETNTLVQFLCVAVISFAAAAVFTYIYYCLKREHIEKDRADGPH